MRGRKLNIEYIKNKFELDGYDLISTDYVNSKKKLKCICSKGHCHYIRWGDWQQGVRCPYCAGNVKYTINFIRSEFEKENYKLISTVYEDCMSKLNYICPNGHAHNITWNEWNNHGNRCPYCAGVARLTTDYVKDKFEIEGYELLTKDYVNSSQKLKYKCPNGHVHSTSWNNWRGGYRCYHCFGNIQPTIEEVNQKFKNENYVLLSNNYVNNKSKLKIMCDKKHIYYTTLSAWQQGKRCRKCYEISITGAGHYNWKGGIKCEPYCDAWADKVYKEDIKARDNYACQNTDCWGTSERLALHHIDYDKKNCTPHNLITLCISCNSRANYNRDGWQTIYENIIINKYGIDKEISNAIQFA